MLLWSATSYAQNPEGAGKLTDEGVALYDQGNYEGAIAKYDEALKLDKNSVSAMAEKAMALESLKKYDETIALCKKTIEQHPHSKSLRLVYTTYGNALDALGKKEQALEVYEEGIKKFPDYHQLYFNKGITLVGIKKYSGATLCFQKSVILNPEHASSHHAIGRLLMAEKKNIPALFALCRFLTIEPQGTRAEANLPFVQKIMKANVEQTSKKNITINIDSQVIKETEKGGKIENNFSSTDMILSMSAAMDYDKKNKNKTEVELFIGKFEGICASLEETHKDNFGFYWEYYAPYFIEVRKQNLLEPFAYIVYASSSDKKVQEWLKANKAKTTKFYDWSASFEWKGK